VTLRQLFYRLVADGTLPNLKKYSDLSAYTAQARRDGKFPNLIDQTSEIVRPTSFDSPEDAFKVVRRMYRRDRTEGEEWSIYIGVEKRGMIEQLDSWFGRATVAP
jgi:hypothetical protein